MECVAKARKWGNSVGVIFPRHVVEKEHIKPNKDVRFLILQDDTTFKKTFGTVKMKQPTQEIMDELRALLYHE